MALVAIETMFQWLSFTTYDQPLVETIKERHNAL
jgi:hypothetical protein